jgi:Polysaccharide biosynthesis enzyme WcbI
MRTQIAYFQAVFPDWDVRGVLAPLASQWINEGHEKFLSFIDEVDLFIGLVNTAPLSTRVSESVRRILVPPFRFNGLHPDMVWLHGVPSPLEQGIVHSPIAASAFMLGRSITETKALFCGAHYEKLGFLSNYQPERTRVETAFRKLGGFEVADLFDTWAETGNFLYLPHHPQAVVFFDIIHRAMQTAGLAKDIDPARLKTARDTLDDYFETGTIWPVYPEIAAANGLLEEPFTWRLSTGKSTGDFLDTEAFLERSWAIYQAHPNKRDDIIKALGGIEEVERFGAP